MLNLIRDYLNKIQNPVIFEMGAHWGEDTSRLMGYCWTKPTYIAFEPDPRNIARIRNQAHTWPLKLVEGAISDKDGRADLFLSDGEHRISGNEMTGANSLRAPKQVKDLFAWITWGRTINVRIRRLDTYCKRNDINHIDFLWADIQGCEYDMLRGAGTMLDNISMMRLEYSDRELYEGQKGLSDILKLLGEKWEVVAKEKTDVLVKKTNKK